MDFSIVPVSKLFNVRWLWRLRGLSRNLTVRAALYCVAGFGAALTGVFFAEYVPDGLAKLLGGSAVEDLISILASSMLAVVTFSLSTMVAAHATVAGAAPPRASTLVIEDVRAQSALSTFLGSFIFSMISLVALSTGYYGAKGRVILFFTTLIVLTMIILTIVRWIGQLSKLSQLGFVIDLAAQETKSSIQTAMTRFAWSRGGYRSQEIDESHPVTGSATGFVQTIDLEALSEICDRLKMELYVDAIPGTFVQPGSKLAWSDKAFDGDTENRIRDCFVIGSERTFGDDPRYGFIVLSEIGSRALSPAINDPGTAIQVLGLIVELVRESITCPDSPAKQSCTLSVRRITAGELFDDAFRSIARDGAGTIEVGVFLAKALVQLAKQTEFQKSAEKMCEDLIARGKHSLTNQRDLTRLLQAGETPS